MRSFLVAIQLEVSSVVFYVRTEPVLETELNVLWHSAAQAIYALSTLASQRMVRPHQASNRLAPLCRVPLLCPTPPVFASWTGVYQHVPRRPLMLIEAGSSVWGKILRSSTITRIYAWDLTSTLVLTTRLFRFLMWMRVAPHHGGL